MAESNGFVVAAYVVTWVGVIGYLVRVQRVSRASRRRLDEASRGGAGRSA